MKLMKKVLIMLLITMMMINVIPVHAVTYTEYKKGDKIKVKVNDTSSLEFYVIEDKGKNSNSLKAIYGGIFNGKFNYEGAKKYLVDLKETWKNASGINLPKMEEIFGDDVELKATFPYDLPTWSFSDSRYWTANKIAWSSGYKTLGTKILEDNTAYADNVRSEFVDSDSGIDFGKVSLGQSLSTDLSATPTNGKGLYYTNNKTQDNKRTYYFRGNVKNNYVKFAGYYWRIMRINEDGSIRLIYSGNGELGVYNQVISYDADAGLSVLTPYSDGVHFGQVGYMFGKNDYNSLELNEKDSDIKKKLDQWYEKNLKTNYEKYISTEAGFCNDRSLYDKEGEKIEYNSYDRMTNDNPQFSCPDEENDLFTTNSSSKGNKALTYPIGLPTADELIYAGAAYHQRSFDYYLYTHEDFWTMTPGHKYMYGVNVIYMLQGYMHYANAGSISDVAFEHEYQQCNSPDDCKTITFEEGFSMKARPVINLKADVEVSQGDGTHDNPYIINTSNKIGSDVVWTLGGTGTGTAQTMDVSETLAIKPVITISKEYVTALDNGDTTPDDGDDGQGGTTDPGDDGDDDGQGGTTDPGDDGNGDQGDGGDDGQGGDNNPGDDEPKNPSTGDNLLVIIGSTIILGGLAVYAYKRRKVNI